MSFIDSALLLSDALNVFGLDPSSQYGLFKDGEQIVQADSVAAFSYSQSYPLSTYPVEEGGFETYDKIELPYDVRMQFVAGGDLSTRQALIASIMEIQADTELYDAVTPEQVYISCNVVHVDYQKTAERGVGLLRVNVYLNEVRVAVSAQYNTATPTNNAAAPEAADPVNRGTVQTKNITITSVVH